MSTKNKTIFIVLSQGLVIRNILRSGGYELFKKRGFILVIFLLCKEIPDYIKQEFNDENVILISIPVAQIDLRRAILHRIFIKLARYLIYNETSKRYFQYGKYFVNRSRLAVFFHLAALRILSRIPALKTLLRFSERTFFHEKNKYIAEYFSKFCPDIVFSSSITSGLDIIFLKEAKRRGVKTISMPKSWDNVSRPYFRFLPDYFLVQNEMVKEQMVKVQDFSRERISVIGFPQFDWYARKNILRSREEHLSKMGLDPHLPVIFFGSQGPWFNDEYRIVELLHTWIENDELAKPCQMIVRPTFKNVRNSPLAKIRGKSRVAFDDSYHISDFFIDNWDPIVPEIIDFTNTLTHSDIVVNIMSTLALDAASVDRPVINCLFGAKFRNGKDITPLMRFVEHYQWVFDTRGTTVVYSSSELKEWINKYLKDPSIKSKEREVLRNNLCHGIDGKSSERMVAAIGDIAGLYFFLFLM